MDEGKHKIVPRVSTTGEVFSLDSPEHWDKYYLHCTVGALVCDTCLTPIYLQKRRGRRIACEYTPAQIAAHDNESHEHQALKDAICTYATQLGLDAEQEQRSHDGSRVTDVLVTGDCSVGWEAQLSPISTGSVGRRVARAVADSIVPSWLTADNSSARGVLEGRAPLATYNHMTAKEIRRATDIRLGGLLGVDIVKCRSQRSERWHRAVTCRGWHAALVGADRTRQPTLAEMIRDTARRQIVPVRWSRPYKRLRGFHVWMRQDDAQRVAEIEDPYTQLVSQPQAYPDRGIKDRWHSRTMVVDPDEEYPTLPHVICSVCRDPERPVDPYFARFGWRTHVRCDPEIAERRRRAEPWTDR
jgi:hypothetical protein